CRNRPKRSFGSLRCWYTCSAEEWASDTGRWEGISCRCSPKEEEQRQRRRRKALREGGEAYQELACKRFAEGARTHGFTFVSPVSTVSAAGPFSRTLRNCSG